MKYIQLSQGKKASIDDADYELVKDYRWSFNGRYAVHTYWNGKGYSIIYMHRLIMNPGKKWVDHANRDGLDNRRSNLRLCTRSQNTMNSKKYGRQVTSKFKGVSRTSTGKMWQAYISGHRIGNFKSETAAAIAYDMWAVQVFGEFAKTNFPTISCG